MLRKYKTGLSDKIVVKLRLARSPTVSWRLWSTLPLTPKRTHLTFAFRHLVADSRTAVPRDIRTRDAGDIADEDDDVAFLDGRVVRRQLVNNRRRHWNIINDIITMHSGIGNAGQLEKKHELQWNKEKRRRLKQRHSVNTEPATPVVWRPPTSRVKENKTSNFCLNLRQILTEFRNSFSDTSNWKSSIKIR